MYNFYCLFGDCGTACVGIDISGERLKDVKSSIVVIQADAQRLPLKANSIDCVLCSEVLEHLVDPDQCIGEVHRVLKSGGVACFTTPCLNIPIPALVSIYRKLIGVTPERAKEHLHVFRDKEVLKMLKQFFRITDIKYTNFTTIIDRTIGIGYGLDRPLSAITKKLPLLRYLATTVWVKSIKNPFFKKESFTKEKL